MQNQFSSKLYLSLIRLISYLFPFFFLSIIQFDALFFVNNWNLLFFLLFDIGRLCGCKD